MEASGGCVHGEPPPVPCRGKEEGGEEGSAIERYNTLVTRGEGEKEREIMIRERGFIR